MVASAGWFLKGRRGAHARRLAPVTLAALRDADIEWSDLSAIAVASGPGLAPGLLSGIAFARAAALARGLPCYGINHLEAHALSPRMSSDAEFPYLLLLISGGHTEILAVEDADSARRLAATRDDALGEAFDKAARMLGLPFPGGARLERLARGGDPTALTLPRPMAGSSDGDFSFSGLKTAFRRRTASAGALSRSARADFAASFQRAVAECVRDRLRLAARRAKRLYGGRIRHMAAAGGAAANAELRRAVAETAREENLEPIEVPLELCADNGAMIAWAAAERLARGRPPSDDALIARPRWRLESRRGAAANSMRLDSRLAS